MILIAKLNVEISVNNSHKLAKLKFGCCRNQKITTS